MCCSIVIRSLLTVSAILFIVKAQPGPLKEKPEACYGTDELMDRRCCVFPPFFSRDVARGCGAMFAVMDINNQHNVTSMRRKIIDNCEHWRCILTKYSILDTEDRVSNDKYFNHLDMWVVLNREFSNVLTNARIICRDKYRFYMPLTACEFFDFQTCIRGHITVNCPKVINSQECYEWKEFFEECKEYFL